MKYRSTVSLSHEVSNIILLIDNISALIFSIPISKHCSIATQSPAIPE